MSNVIEKIKKNHKIWPEDTVHCGKKLVKEVRDSDQNLSVPWH